MKDQLIQIRVSAEDMRRAKKLAAAMRITRAEVFRRGLECLEAQEKAKK